MRSVKKKVLAIALASRQKGPAGEEQRRQEYRKLLRVTRQIVYQAELIRKGKANKPTEFGKLIKLQEAEHQIITHYEVYAARPSDAEVLVGAVQEQEARLGRTPELVAAEAAF